MRPAAAADSRTKLNAWWAKSDIVYGTHAAVLAAADAIANQKGLSDVLPLVDKAVSEADSRSIRYQPLLCSTSEPPWCLHGGVALLQLHDWHHM